MNNLIEKKSLDEFSEKELLKLVLSNQIVILRRMERLFEKIQNVDPRDFGDYSQTFETLVKSSRDVLNQSNKFLSESDEFKGGLNF